MYRPVPHPAREYYGLATLSAMAWRSKGKSVTRNLVGYGGGILDGLEEEDTPFCSLCDAFTHPQCAALGLEHLASVAQSTVIGPERVKVSREGDEVVISFSTIEGIQLSFSLLSTAVSRASTQLRIASCDAAVLLAAIVGSYAYVWFNRSGSLAPKVGMIISVRSSNDPGRPVYGTPGCTRSSAAWHPLFYRVGIKKSPFRPNILFDGDCLNPPFLGYAFARCVDALETRCEDVTWVQLVAPLGWLPELGVPSNEQELVVADELTSSENNSISPCQLCSFRLSIDKIAEVRGAFMLTIEGIKEGWGAHLPWRVPVLIVRVSSETQSRAQKGKIFSNEVKSFAEPSVLSIQGQALLAHRGSREPFLVTCSMSMNAFILTPPGVVVQPLGDSLVVCL
jgi:hypothetical protein